MIQSEDHLSEFLMTKYFSLVKYTVPPAPLKNDLELKIDHPPDTEYLSIGI